MAVEPPSRSRIALMSRSRCAPTALAPPFHQTLYGCHPGCDPGCQVQDRGLRLRWGAIPNLSWSRSGRIHGVILRDSYLTGQVSFDYVNGYYGGNTGNCKTTSYVPREGLRIREKSHTLPAQRSFLP